MKYWMLKRDTEQRYFLRKPKNVVTYIYIDRNSSTIQTR